MGIYQDYLGKASTCGHPYKDQDRRETHLEVRVIRRQDIGKGSTGSHPVVDSWHTWQKLLQVVNLIEAGHVHGSTARGLLCQLPVQ